MDMQKMINSMEEINEELETAIDETEAIKELSDLVPEVGVQQAVAGTVPFCCLITIPRPLSFVNTGLNNAIAYSLDCLRCCTKAVAQAIPTPCGTPSVITVYETRIVGWIRYWASAGQVIGTCLTANHPDLKPTASCSENVCVDVLIRRSTTPPTPTTCPPITCTLVSVSPVTVEVLTGTVGTPCPEPCPTNSPTVVRFTGVFYINCPV